MDYQIIRAYDKMRELLFTTTGLNIQRIQTENSTVGVISLKNIYNRKIHIENEIRFYYNAPFVNLMFSESPNFSIA